MPSDARTLAIEQATRLKSDEYLAHLSSPPADEERDGEREMLRQHLDGNSRLTLFRPSSDGTAKILSAEEFAQFSDLSYEEFNKMPEHCQMTDNFQEELLKYLQTVSVDELADRLLTVSDGLAADVTTGVAQKFTITQRLLISIVRKPPFARVITFKARYASLPDSGFLRFQFVDPTLPLPMNATTPKNINLQLSIAKGGVSEWTLMDVCTGGGKTGMTLALAASMLSEEYVADLTRHEEESNRNKIVMSDISTALGDEPVIPGRVRMARLAIVATDASTYNHFVKTLEQLVTRMRVLDPNFQCNIWTKVGMNTSTLRAYEATLEGIVTFWVVPVGRLMDILKAHPHISVPVCIVDEYRKAPTSAVNPVISPVAKIIIANATPQSLCDSIRGHSNRLKDFFEGVLHPPSSIGRQVARHEHKSAYLTAKNAAKLRLISTGPWMRERVRRELQQYMPPSIRVHYVKCTGRTAVARLAASSADFVPADFQSTLRHFLQNYYPTQDCMNKLVDLLKTSPPLSVVVKFLKEGLHSTNPSPNESIKERAISRLEEIDEECPICFKQMTGVQDHALCGACGYGMCTTCRARCPRCPFCRDSLPRELARANVMRNETRTEEAAETTTTMQTDTPETTHEMCARLTSTPGSQYDKFVRVLRGLGEAGFKRTLIIVERHRFDREINMTNLQEETGFQMPPKPVNALLTGKGREFAKIKADFDSPDPRKKALLSHGVDDKFLVGTNLDHVDSLVVVGEVERRILEQTLGRVFRPRVTRDNTKPIEMVCIRSY